jgi:hypothetical protein
MSSLRERAKTLVEIIKASCSYVYLTRCKDCMGKCEFEGTESFAGKWVRLEDAQEAIEKLQTAFNIIYRTNEKLKQKLLELEYLVNRLPNVMYNALGDHTFYEENVKELKKKFKELLKENE